MLVEGTAERVVCQGRVSVRAKRKRRLAPLAFASAKASNLRKPSGPKDFHSRA